MKFSRVCSGLAVVAVLGLTMSVQAIPQVSKKNWHQPEREGDTVGQAPNAGSIDDDCTTGGFPLGMLTPFMGISTDTTGLNDDFGCDPGCATGCPGGCGFFGGADSDGIAVFQVPTSGSWTFSGCASVNYDSALIIRQGGACPGASCVAQDGDSCAACASPYKARVTANLLSGQDYYLIVDGYSGTGGVIDLRVTGPCASALDCQDGIFCNGAEVCTLGQCAAGPNPCTGSTPLCNEATDTCSGCSSNPGACLDDALFCNGPGACLPSGACGQAGNPCSNIQTCDEAANMCVNIDACNVYYDDCHGFVCAPGFVPSGFFVCQNGGIGDDIAISNHATRELVSYQFEVFARNRPCATNAGCTQGWPGGCCATQPPGTLYNVTTELWSVTTDGNCVPDAPIPGTQCTVSGLTVDPGGSNPDLVLCEPNGGLPTGVMLPQGSQSAPGGGILGETCGIDFWVVMRTDGDGVGPSLSPLPLPPIGNGSPFADDVGTQVIIFEDCDQNNGVTSGSFSLNGLASFNPGGVGDFAGMEVCTVPVGACCDATAGTCSEVTQDDCLASGGTYLGDIFSDGSGGCDSGTDTDGDGSRDECDLCDNDPLKTAPGQCGCGIADTDSDGDGTANCNDLCPSDPGKIVPGICGCGIADTDTDGDGTADCQDGCPDDPNKTAAGICGCGTPETGDSDGDGVSDCVDQCPGVDDAVFFPGCQGAIPTVSEWGMIVLALVLLIGAKVYFGRKPELA